MTPANEKVTLSERVSDQTLRDLREMSALTAVKGKLLNQIIDELLSLRSTPTSEGAEWQPIATAPRDGTVVFCFWDTHEMQPAMFQGFWCDPVSPGEGFSNPTHWRPLPPPPNSVATPAASPAAPEMAMLPNDSHPGAGCSCAECLRVYPTASNAAAEDPHQQCSVCGRKSWGNPTVQAICWMPQPDGSKCQGVLRLVSASNASGERCDVCDGSGIEKHDTEDGVVRDDCQSCNGTGTRTTTRAEPKAAVCDNCGYEPGTTIDCEVCSAPDAEPKYVLLTQEQIDAAKWRAHELLRGLKTDPPTPPCAVCEPPPDAREGLNTLPFVLPLNVFVKYEDGDQWYGIQDFHNKRLAYNLTRENATNIVALANKGGLLNTPGARSDER